MLKGSLKRKARSGSGGLQLCFRRLTNVNGPLNRPPHQQRRGSGRVTPKFLLGSCGVALRDDPAVWRGARQTVEEAVGSRGDFDDGLFPVAFANEIRSHHTNDVGAILQEDDS